MPSLEPILPAAWTWRRVVGATFVVLFVAFGFWLLLSFRFVIFVIFIGVVVSTAISPIVSALQRRGVPSGWAVILIYILLLAILVGFAYLAIPLLAEQAIAVAPRIEDGYEDLRSLLLDSPNRFVRQLGLELPSDLLALVRGRPTPDEPLDVVAQTLGAAGAIAGVLITLLWIMLIGFYWTVERERTIRALLLIVPSDQRDGLRELGEAMGAKVGAYVRGQAILAVSVGVSLLIAYLLIGLPYAAVLALIAGLMELIPVFGPTLSAIPAVLLTLALDPSKVILVIVISAALQFVENNILAPRIMHKTVGVNPIVTLLALAAFGALFGLPGILLAIPMAAILQIVIDRFILSRPPQEPAGRDRLSRLRYSVHELAQDVRQRARSQEQLPDTLNDQIEDEIEAIATDLDSLLAQVVPSRDSS